MAVRLAAAADAPAVARLHRRVRTVCLPYLPDLHTPEEDLAFFRDRVLPETAVHVATDGAVIGFIAARPGWIDHLYVAPERHGQGVGGALVAAAVPDFGPDVRLWTFQRNTAARAFYERRGFRCVALTDGSGNEEREPDALYRRGGDEETA